jgi:molecular chaperone DnaK (HSP70)
LAGKYIVGIDLGTTNSALARCDATAAGSAAEEESRIEIRGIPQLVNPNEVAERTLLPSFLYIPGEPKPAGRLRQVLALIRWGGPHRADLAVASARGGAQAIAG